MNVSTFSIAADDLRERILFRLAGNQGGRHKAVLWRSRGGSVLVQLSRLQLQLKHGWLLCDLPLSTTATQRQNLQLVYRIGEDGDADGVAAACTVHTSSDPAARLAARWGRDLQRVVWDGVLDLIEGSLNHATRLHPGQPLRVIGFTCSPDGLQVDLGIGTR